MKIVTCASYYGSGSSAITDLLSEFRYVKSLTNYEFRFAQDPDGLSELEFNLIENFNRHNSGHALKRYKKMVDYYSNHVFVKRYEPFFNNKWKKLSYDFIDSLIDFSYPGVWQYDYYDRGGIYEFFCKLPDRILTRTIWRNKPDKHFLLGRHVTYASHPSETKFLECTKAYTSALMDAANPQNIPILLVDQLLPSSNIKRHIRYFDNIQVVLVDRDPRDIYLLNKYEYNDSVVPKDIDIFCKWYEYTRSTQSVEIADNPELLFIHFEDMVYKYDDTVSSIIEWCGLDIGDHFCPKYFFDPEVSRKNTKYWVSHPECKEEADQIAKKLPNYLYQYDGD